MKLFYIDKEGDKFKPFPITTNHSMRTIGEILKKNHDVYKEKTRYYGVPLHSMLFADRNNNILGIWKSDIKRFAGKDKVIPKLPDELKETQDENNN